MVVNCVVLVHHFLHDYFVGCDRPVTVDLGVFMKKFPDIRWVSLALESCFTYKAFHKFTGKGAVQDYLGQAGLV